jgi:hypothetical protein
VLLIEAYERLGQHDHAAAGYDRYQRVMRRDLHLEPRHAVACRFEPLPPVGRTAPREGLVPVLAEKYIRAARQGFARGLALLLRPRCCRHPIG